MEIGDLDGILAHKDLVAMASLGVASDRCRGSVSTGAPGSDGCGTRCTGP